MPVGSESIFTAFAATLKVLGKASTAPGTHDATVYGASRARLARPTDCFYAHHVAATSSAIVLANARTVLNAASSMGFKLSVGLPGAT